MAMTIIIMMLAMVMAKSMISTKARKHQECFLSFSTSPFYKLSYLPARTARTIFFCNLRGIYVAMTIMIMMMAITMTMANTMVIAMREDASKNPPSEADGSIAVTGLFRIQSTDFLDEAYDSQWRQTLPNLTKTLRPNGRTSHLIETPLR